MNEELEEKILEYFKPVKLKILDNGFNERGYYHSVTVPYIYEWLLNKKYKMSDIIEKLLELHINEKLYSLYCGTVENVVFHNRIPKYWNYGANNDYEKYNEKYAYKYFINYLQELKLEYKLKT